MTPDHRFRRAEGSGPWLHPPRKPARTAPGSAVMLAIFFVASVIAGLGISALAGSPAPDMPHGPGWEICGKEWRC